MPENQDLSELGKELWDSASKGKSGNAKMLLAAGASPNHVVRTGLISTSTPLIVSSCKGHSEVVSLLLEHQDCNVNIKVSGGWTALMWAAWYGHTDIVKMLLAVPGIKVDTLNQAGNGTNDFKILK